MPYRLKGKKGVCHLESHYRLKNYVHYNVALRECAICARIDLPIGMYKNLLSHPFQVLNEFQLAPFLLLQPFGLNMFIPCETFH
jgi:hypothetical protein